jgi:hypothetical protein
LLLQDLQLQIAQSLNLHFVGRRLAWRHNVCTLASPSAIVARLALVLTHVSVGLRG